MDLIRRPTPEKGVPPKVPERPKGPFETPRIWNPGDLDLLVRQSPAIPGGGLMGSEEKKVLDGLLHYGTFNPEGLRQLRMKESQVSSPEAKTLRWLRDKGVKF